MKTIHQLGRAISLAIFSLTLLASIVCAQNQVLGEVQFVGSHKSEKTAGVWVDGQYVGYVTELREDKKLMLLPGQHEISIRQTGYLDLTQTYVIEPAKKLIITVKLDRDPKAQFSAITSEVKLKVTPERAAVFVDGNFAGYAQQFSGVGKGMLVSPGAHHIKIALAGYQEFDTDVNLLPKQKMTIKTDLVAGSITQAPAAIKQN